MKHNHPNKHLKTILDDIEDEYEEIELEEEECVHCGGRGCEYCMPDDY